jgi:metallo-beta-lactamase family protein
VKLAFHGAAGEVTGACFLVDTGKLRFLIDCGMVQGGRAVQARNRRFAFDPRGIAFVLLSHAHIDHSGLLPRLVAEGFRGAIYATQATLDLCGVMLPDSGHLQEKEAEWRGGAPLYTVAQAEACLARFIAVDYAQAFKPHPQVRCVLRDAGHILGSAIVELIVEGRKLVYSGDLGQPGRPIVADPTPVAEADVLLVESTYGDRDHKNLPQTLDELAYAINDTLASKRGNVLIPSFAVGRTQDLLHYLGELQKARRLPAKMDVYVDSPMATAATRITLKYARLPPLERLQFTQSVEDSQAINAVRAGAVIISASGMCEGGRIRYHLRNNIGRPECALVFPSFQAAGTLGRRIVDGARTVRLFGEQFPVRAKVFTINGLSSHADRSALLAWLGHFRRPPRQTFVVHGETLAAHSLRDAIAAKRGWTAGVAERGRTADI